MNKNLAVDRRRRWRRTLAAAAGTVLLSVTAACGSGSDKAVSGRESVKFGVFPVFVSLPIWVAKEKGFFDKNGLDVALKTITTGPAMISALASNSIDAMIIGETSVESARASGLSIKMVSVTYPTSISHILASNEVMKTCTYVGQPYPKPMLCAKGKRVGIIGGVGTESYTVGVSLLSAAGMTEKDVSFVPIGGGEAGGNFLKEGKIDIQLGEDTAAAFTELLGVGKSLMDVRKQGVFADWVGEAVWAMEPNLKKSPKKFQKLADSMDEAVAWIRDPANKDEAVKIFKKYAPAVSEPTIAKVVESTRESWGSEASCDQVMNVVNWLVETKTIEAAKADKSCDELVWKTAHISK